MEFVGPQAYCYASGRFMNRCEYLEVIRDSASYDMEEVASLLRIRVASLWNFPCETLHLSSLVTCDHASLYLFLNHGERVGMNDLLLHLHPLRARGIFDEH